MAERRETATPSAASYAPANPRLLEGASTIRRVFAVSEHSLPADAALLLIRIVAGLAFMIHGWSKIRDPFGWMGPEGFAHPVFQALAAISEFGGGLAWMLGFVTPLASLGIACTMAVAFYMHAFLRGDPFVAKGGGMAYEPAAVYFCVALVLMTVGPGRFSLDRLIFGVRRRPA